MTQILNPEQKKAVETTKGRVLVLAGAGSGKTRVIIHRIRYLLSKGVSPDSILGLTFTNKAAKEMRDRLCAMTDKKTVSKVTLCTFHSFCMNLLRKEIKALGYTSSFTLYDTRDMIRLAEGLAKEILKSEEIPSLSSSIEEISRLENQHADNPPIEDGFLKKLYSGMKEALKAYNAVNFDTLLSLTVQLFTHHPAILEKYQDKYRYIMIDEYQDTNRIQSQIAELLAKKYNNLCVVGDDDQSIYGWRGAIIDNILQFPADTTIRLQQNYRCYPSILSAANSVIAHNKKRHNKKLFSQNPEDNQVELFHAPTEQEEASSVIDRILYLHNQQKIPFRDMAILYRSNLISRNFELALMNASYKRNDQWVRGIPYEVYGGLEFSERSEIKDLLAYLKVIANEKDQEAILRIINVPRRGISAQTIDSLTSFQRENKHCLWDILTQIETYLPSLKKPLTSQALTGIHKFTELIQEAKEHFAEKSLENAFDWLIQKINYQELLQSEVKSEKALQYKWENVLELKNTLAQYEEEKEDASLAHFISTTMLARNIPSEKFGGSQEKLKLLTFHSAKGLEFDVCFLVALEDHILPHEKSMMDTGLEEERRLFYVAITRAKRYLTLSMARKRKKMGKVIPTNPSRFLFEIPKTLLRLSSFKMFP